MPRKFERVITGCCYGLESVRRVYLNAKFLGRNPCCNAWRRSCATLRTFRRRIKLNRWTSTVRTLIARRRAISRFVLPCETSLRISLCRGVKPSVRLPDGLVDLCGLTGLIFLAGFAALVDLVVFFAFAVFLERTGLRCAIDFLCPKFYC
jgi:hypothetical protein